MQQLALCELVPPIMPATLVACVTAIDEAHRTCGNSIDIVELIALAVAGIIPNEPEQAVAACQRISALVAIIASHPNVLRHFRQPSRTTIPAALTGAASMTTLPNGGRFDHDAFRAAALRLLTPAGHA